MVLRFTSIPGDVAALGVKPEPPLVSRNDAILRCTSTSSAALVCGLLPTPRPVPDPCPELDVAAGHAAPLASCTTAAEPNTSLSLAP